MTFHREDGIELHLRDFREAEDQALHSHPAHKAKLALFDPPYGVGKSKDNRRRDSRGRPDNRKLKDMFHMDEEEAFSLMLEAIEWGLRNAKTVICTIGTLKNQARMWVEKPPVDVVCYYKYATPKLSPVGFSDWEPVFVYGKAYGPAHNFLRVRPIPLGTFGHPCPKPIGWATFFIERWTKPGDMVLDPFAGSGTVQVAAKLLGRRSIGWEIEESYLEAAVDRLRQTALPLVPVRDPEPMKLELQISS